MGAKEIIVKNDVNESAIKCIKSICTNMTTMPSVCVRSINEFLNVSRSIITKWEDLMALSIDDESQAQLIHDALIDFPKLQDKGISSFHDLYDGILRAMGTTIACHESYALEYRDKAILIPIGVNSIGLMNVVRHTTRIYYILTGRKLVNTSDAYGLATSASLLLEYAIASLDIDNIHKNDYDATHHNAQIQLITAVYHSDAVIHEMYSSSRRYCHDEILSNMLHLFLTLGYHAALQLQNTSKHIYEEDNKSYLIPLYNTCNEFCRVNDSCVMNNAMAMTALAIISDMQLYVVLDKEIDSFCSGDNIIEDGKKLIVSAISSVTSHYQFEPGAIEKILEYFMKHC